MYPRVKVIIYKVKCGKMAPLKWTDYGDSFIVLLLIETFGTLVLITQNVYY